MIKSIIIKIDEPFDFHKTTNIPEIKGNLLGFCKGPQKKNWRDKYLLVDLEKNIKWKKNNIKQMILSTRYEGDSEEDIINGKEIVVNIGIVDEHFHLDVEQKFNKTQIIFFGIGAVKVLKK